MLEVCILFHVLCTLALYEKYVGVVPYCFALHFCCFYTLSVWKSTDYYFTACIVQSNSLAKQSSFLKQVCLKCNRKMIKSKINANIILLLIYFQYILQILFSFSRIPVLFCSVFFYSVTVSVIHKEPLKHFVFFFSINGEVSSGEWLQSTGKFRNDLHI